MVLCQQSASTADPKLRFALTEPLCVYHAVIGTTRGIMTLRTYQSGRSARALLNLGRAFEV